MHTWELERAQNPFPTLDLKEEETVAEVAHGAPDVLVRKLRGLLVRTLNERPERALNL